MEKDNALKAGDQPQKTKKLLIIILVLVLLVIGGAAAYFFLFAGKEENNKKESNSKAEALMKQVPEQAQVGPMVEIKEFVVNIISEDEPHYVKASLSLELDQESTLDEVNKRMAQIQDSILLLIGNKTFEELQDLQGKEQVKAEIKNKINSFLRTGKVNNIYLTGFVVQ